MCGSRHRISFFESSLRPLNSGEDNLFHMIKYQRHDGCVSVMFPMSIFLECAAANADIPTPLSLLSPSPDYVCDGQDSRV